MRLTLTHWEQKHNYRERDEGGGREGGIETGGELFY